LYRKISGGDVLAIERLMRREKAADWVGDHAFIEVGLVKATSNARTQAEILMVRMGRGRNVEGLQNVQESAMVIQCDPDNHSKGRMVVVLRSGSA
jgi:hypothetical protein